jgi:hypothetical protein
MFSTRTPDTGRRSRSYVHAGTEGVWMLLLTLVLSIAAPLYLITSTADVGRDSAWVLTVPVVVWAGWRLARLVSQGSDSYAPLMFWIFNYIFFGLAPLVQLRTGLLPTTTRNVLARYDERTMVVVLISLGAYEIGRRIGSKRGLRSRDRMSLPRVVPARIVTLFCWGGLVLSWGYLVRVGLGNVTSSRLAQSNARSAVWPDPAVSEIAYAMAIVPLLVAAHLLILGRTRKDLVASTTMRRGLALLVFPTLALVVNLFGSPRYIFGAVWLSILVQMTIARTVRQRRAFCLSILFGFLFVFPLADKFSRSNATGKTFKSFDVFQGNGDYDAFAQTNNGINMVAHVGLSYGRQLLGVLFFWVPRSIWSGKPDDTAIVISKFMDYDFKNLSAPLVVELYVNAGYVLVVVGFTAIGFLMSQSLGRGGASNSAALCIAVCVVPFYAPILLRGSLLQATGFAALFAVCTLVVKWLGRASVDAFIAKETSPT